ncbi:MAG TPA: hypothetical protein VM434_14615 [Beijerinckiaceae bacterium]|nr:hypothetical protein [Beijerinckiaceae bacterium]
MASGPDKVAAMLAGCISLVEDTHDLLIEKGVCTEAEIIARLEILLATAEGLGRHYAVPVRLAVEGRRLKAGLGGTADDS